MNGVHSGVFQDLTIIGFGAINVEFVGQAAGFVDPAFPNGVHVHGTKTTDGFQVYAAHKAGAENSSLQSMHDGHQCTKLLRSPHSGNLIN